MKLTKGNYLTPVFRPDSYGYTSFTEGTLYYIEPDQYLKFTQGRGFLLKGAGKEKRFCVPRGDAHLNGGYWVDMGEFGEELDEEVYY